MFTPMLSAPGSGCAGLERMQKWVRLTQLELRKLISKPVSARQGLRPSWSALPLTTNPIRANLRRNVNQVTVSSLGFPRNSNN